MAENENSISTKCPFPGMDPILETRFSDLHSSMSTYARDALAENLPVGLVARLEEYVILENEEEETHSVHPDVSTFESPNVSAANESGGTLVADVAAAPLLVLRRAEPETLRYISVQESGSGRLITTIEFISPRNKVGREAAMFREKQSDLLGRVSTSWRSTCSDTGPGLFPRPSNPRPWR
jgi:hypothetical protein